MKNGDKQYLFFTYFYKDKEKKFYFFGWCNIVSVISRK